MGLSSAAVRFLIREHCRDPFRGPALTLGRQYVFLPFDRTRQMMREEGLTPVELPAGTSSRSNIPEWQGTPLAENVSDTALFQMLGLPKLEALDCSTYEGAEIVADLNQPVPVKLQNRFGLVLDSGTLEHLFNVRQGLMNIASLIAPGGRVIHITPANNYLNHGFYQVSPTLYWDYYLTNRFADVAVYVAEQVGRDPRYSPWDLFRVDFRTQAACMRSRYPMLTICIARRTEESTIDRIPIQSLYQRQFSPAVDSAPPIPVAESLTPVQRLKRLVPAPIRDFLRPWIIGRGERRPWGCARIGRLR